MADTINAGENAAITQTVGGVDATSEQTAYPSTTASGESARYYAPSEGREHLAGFFDTRDEAESAVAGLEQAGVPHADISVVYRDAEDGTAAVSEPSATGDPATGDVTVGAAHVSSKAGEAAGTGSVVGGTVGAVLGALAATATAIAIPGLGILIAGPIAGALAGAGAGGLTGGLFGALVGAGIPDTTAQEYETGVHSGGVVVIADVPAHLAQAARAILHPSSVATAATPL